MNTELKSLWGFVLLALLLGACSQDSSSPVSKDTSLFPLQQENQTGLINEDGEWIVSPRFDRIDPFSNGMAKAWKGGKYGWINASGEVISEPIYSGVYTDSRYYEELYVLNKIPIGIKNGDFFEGIAPVNLDGKHGFIDESGEFIVQPLYDAVTLFVDGLAAVRLGNNWGFINTSGEYVVNPMFEKVRPFSEGMAAVEQSSWGYINEDGEIAINPMYEYAKSFRYGGAIVWQGDIPFLIDKTGEIKLTIPYSGERETRTASKELIVFEDDSGQGLMNTDGETLIGPGEYRYLSNPTDGIILAARKDGKFGFLDESGMIVIPPQFDRVELGPEKDLADVGIVDAFKETVLPVRLGNRWGLIDESGKYVMPPQYEDISSFDEGMAIAENGGKYGYIETDGTLSIPLQFDRAMPFSEGLAAVRVGDKWGYIDQTGAYVVSPQYDVAMNFQSGYAYVSNRSPKMNGYIDHEGELGNRRYPTMVPQQSPDAPSATSSASSSQPLATVSAVKMVSLVQDLRVRNQPNSSAPAIAGLAEGERVTWDSRISDFTYSTTLRGQYRKDYWYRVRTQGGMVGWVFGGAMRMESGERPLESSMPSAVINDPDGYSNVRSDPGSQYEVIGQIRQGQLFKIHDDIGDWWLVRIPGGSLGYMHRSRIQVR